jgi:hypothetical protein
MWSVDLPVAFGVGDAEPGGSPGSALRAINDVLDGLE